jgi:hypothetical protein
VGFKFHAVLVVNSAHLAGLAAPDRDRWLPLLWAVDNFKASQARNQREGNWAMAPVRENALPDSTKARQQFIDSMDRWDEEGSDQAIAALVRTAGAAEIAELFWRFGARDFRDIGHKAIYVANAWRTLQTIGWRHSEPVMRSLAYALLEHEEGNPADRDALPDRPWRENIERVTAIPTDWQDGRVSSEATTDLLTVLRDASHSDACEKVVELLQNNVSPASLWDGLFLAAGELLMRHPGIIALHSVTAANALHFGYEATGNDQTRQLLLLQCAAFMTMFRQALEGHALPHGDVRIDNLELADLKADGAGAVEEIFADVSNDRLLAARKTLAWLERGDAEAPHALMTAARRLVFNKGDDSHDYKFSSATLEDFFHATPAWRNRYLATSMFHLHGSGDRDNDLIQSVRRMFSENSAG